MEKFDHLLELPGPSQYQAWVKERLETLSVRESYVLAAILQRAPPRDAEEVVDRLNSLEDHDVCPARSYEELGRFQLQRLKVPESALPHMDLEQLGRMYEDEHPGIFIGRCFVACPKQSSPPFRQKNGTPLLQDDSWSVKLKLASPAMPEGVWLRLPDYALDTDYGIGEIDLACYGLGVDSLVDCTLLEAQCILPEAGDLMTQYSDIGELVRDGDNLGHIMDEQGQGKPHWMEKFAAALEYEDCRTLKFALDISQNLHCYEWVSSEGLADFAADHLRSCGMPGELIRSGTIDLDGYGTDLLETSGYMLSSGETGYVIRNNRQFIYEHSLPYEKTLARQDILKTFPLLEQLASQASREDAVSARTAITKALASQGDDGLRHLQAALEFEDCAALEEAVEIAGRLDSYEFVEIGSFRKAAEKELLEKGLDKRVIDLCIDFEAYAAVAYDLESIYSSRNTGLYVHRSDPMSQPEQGMTMQ